MKIKFLVLFLIIIVVAVIESVIIFDLNSSLFYGGVRKFGPLMLGGDAPIRADSSTFAPQLNIPSSKFYIGVAQKNLWCTFENCSPHGKVVAILGGWLQSDDTDHPTTKDDYGVGYDTTVKSIVVVGDKYGRIVGIYPNKTIDDLLYILKIHKNLW